VRRNITRRPYTSYSIVLEMRSGLARDGICEAAPFGSPVYSKEELTAEMGAAYLCAEARISPAVIQNQAAYIAGWLT